MDNEILKSKLSEYYDNENLLLYKLTIINNFENEIKSIFFEYLETNKIPSYDINGWTIEKILNETGENVIESFIRLDKMKKDPIYAEGFKYLVFGRM